MDNTNLNGLVELARRNGVDIQPTLLRVMTDLYVQKPVHSAEEEQHFTELALRLIEVVDSPTRVAIAERIAGYPTAPAAVRQRLLRETITLAAPIVATTPAVDPFGGKPASARELSELFFAASAPERWLILLNLPYAPLPLAAAIAPTVAREAVRQLEIAALGRDREAFAQVLERTLGIGRGHAQRLIEDPSGEPIVVVAVVLAMPSVVLQRILLCLDASISQSVQRVYELADLQYEIAAEAALRLLAIWQASHGAISEPRPSAHRPQQHADQAQFTDTRIAPAARPNVPWHGLAEARKPERA
jgi:hypothetical protein